MHLDFVSVKSSFSDEPNGSHAIFQASSMQYGVDGKAFQMKQISSDMPKVIDASQLFKPPHRASRPDHFVIILRGLPGWSLELYVL